MLPFLSSHFSFSNQRSPEFIRKRRAVTRRKQTSGRPVHEVLDFVIFFLFYFCCFSCFLLFFSFYLLLSTGQEILEKRKYFLNLRTSEIHLFYNLQLFYWHFLEFLWLFIFQVFYFSFLFSLLLEVAIILLMIGLLLLEIDVDTISVVSLVTARQEIGCDARFIFGI